MLERSTSSAGRFIEMRFNSDPANLATVRRAIEAFCGNCGFDENARGQVIISVNEALTNVMRHAYQGATDQPIVLRVEMCDQTLSISIRDWGSGVNPAERPERQRDPLKPGGLGMLCLRQYMDDVIFEPQGDGMLLTMRRKKPLEESGAGSDRAVG